MTRILKAGLIGDNIQKTRLPLALDIMCREHQIELEFSLMDTAGQPDFDFNATVDELISSGWSGVTVTHPHKIKAARYAGPHMVEAVRHLPASNTLVFGESIAGFNTDYVGFLNAWEHTMGGTKPGIVAMAGAGGVASALGPALVELGAEKIFVWDLEPEKAERLADLIGTIAIAVPASQAGRAIKAATGLVNATALGMAQYPGSAFESELIGSQGWAFDAVYTPTRTRFLEDAAHAGLSTLTGFDLFKHMAIESFAAYTGVHVDHELTLAKLEQLRPD